MELSKVLADYKPADTAETLGLCNRKNSGLGLRTPMKERKEDTRRKILVGSYYLDKAKKDGSFDELVKHMDKFLVRDSERKLFGLSSISKE